VTFREYLRKVGVDLEGDILSEGAQLLAQPAIVLESEGKSKFIRDIVFKEIKT